jgi:hypothetical protein
LLQTLGLNDEGGPAGLRRELTGQDSHHVTDAFAGIGRGENYDGATTVTRHFRPQAGEQKLHAIW